jgi:histidinol dehydrogenase
MLHLDTTQASFDSELRQLLAFETAQDPAVDQGVAAICADVQQRGDQAVIDYTCRFDRLPVTSMDALTLAPQDLEAAWCRLPDIRRQALDAAADRIRRYHEQQLQTSWSGLGFMYLAARLPTPARC